MNLHHLAVFHAIAESGSISASARKLHISQPALSRELKTFETRLGVQLFERMPRGMRLTEAGCVLHEHSTRLFALEREAEAAMRDLVDARHGRLSLGASNTIGTYFLPRVLAILRRERPEVNVSLFVGNTEQVARGVLDMHYMLGFIEGPLHLTGLDSFTFEQDELVPVVSADHPLLERTQLSLGDIRKLPLLMREPGSGTRELIANKLKLHNSMAHGQVMEFGNTEALKQAVLHGGGVAWLPRISVHAELRNGSLREVGPRQLHIRRPLKVLRRARAHVAPVERVFLDHLKPGLGERI